MTNRRLVSTRKKVPRLRKPLPSVGWREWTSLPELGIRRIKAKIDTGARSSSIHIEDLRIVNSGRGQIARFRVYPHQRNSAGSVSVEAPIREFRRVISSTGHATIRPTIVTIFRIGDNEWPIELTLADRNQMGFRILIGRNALRRRFVVDPGRSYLVGKERKKRNRKSILSR